MSNSVRNLTICLLGWLTLMVSNWTTIFRTDTYGQVEPDTTPATSVVGGLEWIFLIAIVIGIVIIVRYIRRKGKQKVPYTPPRKVPDDLQASQLNRHSRVFISYAREDSDPAVRLYEDIKTRTNLKPWLDREDLLPGENWDQKIREAIENSKYFIALFSSTSVQKRGYLQKEFKHALDVLKEIPEGNVFIIPVRLDNCEIPFEVPYEKLKKTEYVDLFPNWFEGIRRLSRTFDVY